MGIQIENVNTEKAVCNGHNFELYASFDLLTPIPLYIISLHLSLSLCPFYNGKGRRGWDPFPDCAKYELRKKVFLILKMQRYEL